MWGDGGSTVAVGAVEGAAVVGRHGVVQGGGWWSGRVVALGSVHGDVQVVAAAGGGRDIVAIVGAILHALHAFVETGKAGRGSVGVRRVGVVAVVGRVWVLPGRVQWRNAYAGPEGLAAGDVGGRGGELALMLLLLLRRRARRRGEIVRVVAVLARVVALLLVLGTGRAPAVGVGRRGNGDAAKIVVVVGGGPRRRWWQRNVPSGGGRGLGRRGRYIGMHVGAGLQICLLSLHVVYRVSSCARARGGRASARRKQRVGGARRGGREGGAGGEARGEQAARGVAAWAVGRNGRWRPSTASARRGIGDVGRGAQTSLYGHVAAARSGERRSSGGSEEGARITAWRCSGERFTRRRMGLPGPATASARCLVSSRIPTADQRRMRNRVGPRKRAQLQLRQSQAWSRCKGDQRFTTQEGAWEDSKTCTTQGDASTTRQRTPPPAVVSRRTSQQHCSTAGACLRLRARDLPMHPPYSAALALRRLPLVLVPRDCPYPHPMLLPIRTQVPFGASPASPRLQY